MSRTHPASRRHKALPPMRRFPRLPSRLPAKTVHRISDQVAQRIQQLFGEVKLTTDDLVDLQEKTHKIWGAPNMVNVPCSSSFFP